MKKLLILLFIIQTYNVFGQERLYHFNLFEIYQDSSTYEAQYKGFYQAIDLWKNFILQGDEHVFVKEDQNDSNLMQLIGSYIFSDQLSQDAVTFNVINHYIDHGNLILENVMEYNLPEANVHSILAIFKIGIARDGDHFRLYYWTYAKKQYL